MFASGEAATGTTVDWRLPDTTQSLWAEGVQNLLELVLINLMLNAFQAMPNGGRLTIGFRLDAAEVVIEIGDTGVGIPEAHVSKIFDPFFTTRNDSRRSGLGLSVCHSIVRQHGGGLTVRTSPVNGTTFVVRLPSAAPSRESS
jgi:signal transduction histidine kinase